LLKGLGSEPNRIGSHYRFGFKQRSFLSPFNRVLKQAFMMDQRMIGIQTDQGQTRALL
jgi:hypothetical protein